MTWGHEIGIIENPSELDPGSREVLEAELKAIYFVPTISAIRSVVSKGTGSEWTVDTDDGEYTFRIMGTGRAQGRRTANPGNHGRTRQAIQNRQLLGTRRPKPGPHL